MASSEVQKWADEAMFEAEALDASQGPQVHLVSCNPDPLGSIAAAAKAYKGEFVNSLAEITDEERRNYLAEVQKTALAMPLEAVNFHFHLSGVTRGFTHQMVRQRTAAYSQESTRFAVKSTVPVGLPPSLEGTTGELEKIKAELKEKYVHWGKQPTLLQFSDMTKEDQLEVLQDISAGTREWQFRTDRVSEAELWRGPWDATVAHIERTYNYLVDKKMPAEDARGLLPTNLLTQLNYFTSLRGLHDHAGTRLCTQAQFEWRIVWAQILQAIREYGRHQTYDIVENRRHYTFASSWQFEELAKIFKPICYQTGACQFKADFDRKCSIRGRVDANAAINRPSTEWDQEYFGDADRQKVLLGIPAIHPAEWLLDPKAAR